MQRVKDIIRGATSYEALVAIAEQRGEAIGRPERLSGLVQTQTRAKAIINAGRWMIRCAQCANGVPCDPDWEQTVCVDCGTVYQVEFPHPDQRAAIESILSKRVSANQNWEPHETVAFLRRENSRFLPRGVR
jgi:hypothetical protein